MKFLFNCFSLQIFLENFSYVLLALIGGLDRWTFIGFRCRKRGVHFDIVISAWYYVDLRKGLNNWVKDFVRKLMIEHSVDNPKFSSDASLNLLISFWLTQFLQIDLCQFFPLFNQLLHKCLLLVLAHLWTQFKGLHVWKTEREWRFILLWFWLLFQEKIFLVAFVVQLFVRWHFWFLQDAFVRFFASIQSYRVNSLLLRYIRRICLLSVSAFNPVQLVLKSEFLQSLQLK